MSKEMSIGTTKGYLVHSRDEVYGFAVIATSATEAKKIAFPEFEGECDWIDLRTNAVVGHSSISDLPIGLVKDDMLALRRGIYSFIDEGKCDVCGKTAKLEIYKDKALCDDCMKTEK